MSREHSWTIIGHGGRMILNRVLSIGDSNQRLAVMLPGYAYPTAAPLFHYGGRIFASQGFDLLAVDYRYNENTDFRSAPENRRNAWFSADVLAIYESVKEHTQYKQVVFFGKSMGTIAMLEIIGRPLPWAGTVFVWLTPATPEGELFRSLQKHTRPSLVVVGSGDHFYRQSETEQLSALPHVETKVIEGADHGLEYPEDPSRSVAVLPEILDSIARFVSSNFPPPR